MSHEEFTNQLKRLRELKKYLDSVQYYEQNYRNYEKELTHWDKWTYAHCLRKIGKVVKALEICRLIWRNDPEFLPNNNLYAWCIYDTEIKKDQILNEKQFLKAANAIIKLTNQDDKYSPYVITVFKVLNHFKNPYKIDKILEWTEKINPIILDSTEKIINEIKIASDKENYYSIRTEALLRNNKFHDCIELAENALNDIDNFHNDNDIWLKRRIAKSYFHLGNNQISLELLKEILNKRMEWFIQYEIAGIYFELKNYDEALRYAVASAINYGEPKKKIKLFEIIADIMKQKDNIIYAKKHIELLYIIRKRENWPIKEEFKKLLQEYQINEIDINEFDDKYKELIKIWNEIHFLNKIALKGKVKNLLPDGKAGFISAQNGYDYYFKINSYKGKSELLKVGSEVSFYLEDSYDRKKNKPSQIAVNITSINKQ